MAAILSRSGSLRRGGEWNPMQNKGPVISAPLHVSDSAPPQNINLKSASPFDLHQPTGSTLSQRPSTSDGGPASQRLATERITRDDLHLNPLAANRVVFPIILPNSPSPVSVPTLEVTPPLSPQTSSIRDSSSSEVLIADLVEMNVRSHGIGMALGSPSQLDNTAVSWQLPLVPDVHHETIITSDAMSSSGPKPKNNKWKRFFGVKRAATPATYHQSRSDAVQDNNPQESAAASARKGARPGTNRANTAPVFQHHYPQGLRDRNGRTFTAPPDGEPMLRVDIPNIRMERYSVMFGSVLQSGSGESQQSNLLARRQATLDKLKTVNDAIANSEKEEAEFLAELRKPRRATSPQSGSTPTFSLFPATASNTKGISLQNRQILPRNKMHRALTSPTPRSPRMDTFNPNQSQKETHTVMLASTPPHSGNQKVHGQHRWRPDESHLTLSPTSMSDEEGFHNEELPRPPFAERDWAESKQSLSSNPSSPNQQSSRSAPHQRAGDLTLTTSISSTSSTVGPQNYVFSPFASPPAPISTARPTTADEAEVAAAISIARQISVSQRQRQLLIPIKTPKGYTETGPNRTRAGSPPVSRPSPETLVEAGAHKVAEKKPMTPTLVSIETDPQASRHRYRKSERIVLESA